jgi:protein-L-isoaspartate(D-aspartate) O-methyltransferase
VEFAVGDGSCGWIEDRRFDRVIHTAAVPTIPLPLAGQLTDGGLLIAPVGGGACQELAEYRKCGDEMIERTICGCRFVRMIGEHGFRDE